LLASPLRAQVAPAKQQVALSQNAKAEAAKPGNSEASKPADAPAVAAAPTNSGNVAATDQANPSQPKSITSKAIDKVKQVAKSAGDIFSQVPCLSPKGGAKSMGSLPHFAAKLAAGRPVTIIAFGSSSTAGYGSSAPEFTYPNRLATQLRRQKSPADVTGINSGHGGAATP